MAASVSGKSSCWEVFYTIAVLHLQQKQLGNICEGVQLFVYQYKVNVMCSCFWRPVLKRWFLVNCLATNPQILWINAFNAFIHSWMTSQQYQFFLKKWFLQVHLEDYCFNAFSCLGLDVKSVFSRSDDVIRPHSLLRDVTLLSILIENVVLVVKKEKK